MIFLHRSNIVVSTGTAAGNLDVGAEVILNENGAPVNYLIVNQGIPGNSALYDANGNWDSSNCSNSYGIRPDLIPPYDFKFTDAEVVA